MPFECVADAKSAIRWIRTHATEFGIDENRIAAGGGSARDSSYFTKKSYQSPEG